MASSAMQDVVGQIVAAGGSLRQSGDIQPVSMTVLKIGTPVHPYMAKEEEEGPKEDPLGPVMQHLREMQAEEESAKVEGKPKKRAKNNKRPPTHFRTKAPALLCFNFIRSRAFNYKQIFPSS